MLSSFLLEILEGCQYVVAITCHIPQQYSLITQPALNCPHTLPPFTLDQRAREPLSNLVCVIFLFFLSVQSWPLSSVPPIDSSAYYQAFSLVEPFISQISAPPALLKFLAL